MAILLNIDTALESASVCLSREGQPLQLLVNEEKRDHAAWLHPAIQQLLREQQCELQDLQGVAVSIGPGSYTGLRIGLSAAKGLCYALSLPLVTVGTLHLLAHAVKKEATGLICPMIDARRQEVYTAVYDKELNEHSAPAALVLDAGSFSAWLRKGPLLFCGNGSTKFQPLAASPNAAFSKTTCNASHLGELAHNYFNRQLFAPLAYTEPLYIKEFYSPPATRL